MDETEALANKAGLSLHFDENICRYISGLIKSRTNRYKTLSDAANVSERMLQYIRKQKCPSKETLLAILISLGLDITDIQRVLEMAGYALSASLPNDAVIAWLLEHDERPNKSVSLLSHINEVLCELDLPLLMTR